MNAPAFLRRVALVKEGELRPLLLSASYFFCILFAYSLISPFRDEIGMRKLDKLPWLWTGTLIATLVTASAYAGLVSWLPRRRFIPIAYLFFASNLAAFYVVFQSVRASEHAWIGYTFYIWVSVFALFNTAVFWGFMSDSYTPEQGKRLFGAIGVGGTLGSICGSSVPAVLVRGFDVGGRHVHLPAIHLLLISIGFLGLAIVCMLRLATCFGVRSDAEPRTPEPGPNPFEGLRLMVRSPYLLGLCAYMMLYTITSTILSVEQLRIIAGFTTEADKRIASQATVTFYANILTLTTQLFLTGRILTRLGLLFGLLVLPVLTGIGFGAMAWAGLPMVVLVVAAARRGLHYAVDRPTREVLYTVLGPEEKYKSKSFIDTVVYRSGDQVGVWTDHFMTKAGIGIAVLAAVVSVVWIGAGVALNAMNKRLARRE